MWKSVGRDTFLGCEHTFYIVSFFKDLTFRFVAIRIVGRIHAYIILPLIQRDSIDIDADMNCFMQNFEVSVESLKLN